MIILETILVIDAFVSNYISITALPKGLLFPLLCIPIYNMQPLP